LSEWGSIYSPIAPSISEIMNLKKKTRMLSCKFQQSSCMSLDREIQRDLAEEQRQFVPLSGRRVNRLERRLEAARLFDDSFWRHILLPSCGASVKRETALANSPSEYSVKVSRDFVRETFSYCPTSLCNNYSLKK
jgi:hypothetical protein